MQDDFLPTAKLQMLARRALLLKQIRKFFDDRNFMEVETPLLSHDTVVDRYIEPISVSTKEVGNPDPQSILWLQTSPEFAMKRLLAAGAQAIYQITHAFRAGEAGARHNPEFTMLEWYRAGDDQEQAIKLLGEFACTIFQAETFQKMTYRELFQQVLGIDGLSQNVESYSKAAVSAGLDVSAFDGVIDIDGWRNLLLSEAIQPGLGHDVPVVVYDWPASQSALAVCRDEQPPVAERFELYYRGAELANGYHELLDANELRRRNSLVNSQRMSDSKRPLPEESRLLTAMESGIEPCSGVAVGVDRLLMVLTNSTSIADVMAFPIDNA